MEEKTFLHCFVRVFILEFIDESSEARRDKTAIEISKDSSVCSHLNSF